MKLSFYQCPNCGAHLAVDCGVNEPDCYYCGHVLAKTDSAENTELPREYVPFSITREKAQQIFLDSMRGKHFLPRLLREEEMQERLQNVWIPYWVYDSTLSGELAAQATDIHTWDNGNVQYTETKFYDVIREGTVTLANMGWNALENQRELLCTSVFPYDLTKREFFTPDSVLGCQAEIPNRKIEDCEAEAQQAEKKYAGQVLLDSVSGYTAVTVGRHKETVTKEHWSCVLLPVWALTICGRRGQLFYFSINGQTGQTFAKLPLDRKKVFGLAGGVFFAVLLAMLLLFYFL